MEQLQMFESNWQNCMLLHIPPSTERHLLVKFSSALRMQNATDSRTATVISILPDWREIL